MSEIEDLEEAERIFFTPKIPFGEQMEALDMIYETLRKCGISPYTGNQVVLRRKTAQAKGILQEREASEK